MTISTPCLVVLLVAAGVVLLARIRGLPNEISYKGLLIRFPDPPAREHSNVEATHEPK